MIQIVRTETPRIHEIIGVRGRIGLAHECGSGVWEMEFWDIVTLNEMEEIVETLARRDAGRG